MSLSVVVLTFNEADNIERCLRSVAWADDVLVLDSGSSDATVPLALACGARVLTRAFDSFAGQRNYAMEQGELAGDWTLHLDADEEVPAALREELLALMRFPPAGLTVWRVPSRMLLEGVWLRRSGLYPSYQVRFGRTSDLRFRDHGHGQREVQPPSQVGTLAEPLDHHNFSKGMNDWFTRHLRYARQEALQSLSQDTSFHWHELFSRDVTQRRRAVKQAFSGLPFSPLLRFVFQYLLRGGIFEGRKGFQYSAMLAIYQYFIVLNRRELGRNRAP